MERCVWPVIRFRANAWCLTRGLLRSVDAQQRAMITALMRLPKEPAESIDTFGKRRASAAGAVARRVGLWSVRACEARLSWERHLRRGRLWSWATELHEWHARDWLRGRRAERASYSLDGGRTGTRIIMGGPTRRWHDGSSIAQEWPHVITPG